MIREHKLTGICHEKMSLQYFVFDLCFELKLVQNNIILAKVARHT